MGLSTRASRVLHKCRENDAICVQMSRKRYYLHPGVFAIAMVSFSSLKFLNFAK